MSTDSIKTILVATDFSETASRAVQRAGELARRHGARLLVTHAYTLVPMSAAVEGFQMLPPEVEVRMREAALRQLDEWVAEAQEKGGEVEGLLATGNAAAALVEAAQEQDADVIVIGTRGLTGFKHMVIGSTAEEVVRTAGRPVLTVHGEDRTSLSEPGVVVLPVELGDADTDADTRESDQAFAVLGAPKKVILVHADSLPLLLQPIAAEPVFSGIPFAEVAAAARARMEPRAQALRDAGLEVEVVVRQGDPATVILDVAKEQDTSAIALGTRGRRGIANLLLGSTSRRVVQHAHCPVLTWSRKPAAGDGE